MCQAEGLAQPFSHEAYWPPAPDLLIAVEPVAVHFSCQVQTAGTNSPNKLLSLSSRLCDGRPVRLSEGRASHNVYDKRQILLSALKAINSDVGR